MGGGGVKNYQKLRDVIYGQPQKTKNKNFARSRAGLLLYTTALLRGVMGATIVFNSLPFSTYGGTDL